MDRQTDRHNSQGNVCTAVSSSVRVLMRT